MHWHKVLVNLEIHFEWYPQLLSVRHFLYLFFFFTARQRFTQDLQAIRLLQHHHQYYIFLDIFSVLIGKEYTDEKRNAASGISQHIHRQSFCSWLPAHLDLSSQEERIFPDWLIKSSIWIKEKHKHQNVDPTNLNILMNVNSHILSG